MASNSQKTPFTTTQNLFASAKTQDGIQLLGKGLPCTVVAVVGDTAAIVTVSFDLNAPPYTIPNATIPVFGPEYIRYPIQVGDRGVAISLDARIGGTSGLGSGTPSLARPSNLSALVFLPIGNANWTATDDPNALVLYGPNGVVIRDLGKKSTITLTPDGIAGTGQNNVNWTAGSSSLSLAGGTTTLSGDSTSVSGDDVMVGGGSTTTIASTDVGINGSLSVNGVPYSGGGGGGGTVTSVAMTVPSWLSVAGSPVTSAGTLAVTAAAQAAGTFLRGPTSGGSAVPGFGALVAADLPLATVAAFGAVKPDGTSILITAGVISAVGATGANPAATAGATAVNGTAPTFMRSDAAPAVRVATTGQTGLVQPDGSTITISAGVISAVGGATGANPTATAGPSAVNGSAPTFMRSDGAPAVQLATVSQKGLTQPDGTTITISAGVISAVVPAGANPSASVGLSVVNGTALTFMRSDGAPPLSQAIAPSWTGTHQFTVPDLHSVGSASAPGIAFIGNTGDGIWRQTTTNGAAVSISLNSTESFRFGLTAGGKPRLSMGTFISDAIAPNSTIFSAVSGGLANNFALISEGTAASNVEVFAASATGPVYAGIKGRGTIGAFAPPNLGDTLCNYQFSGQNTTGATIATTVSARIRGLVTETTTYSATAAGGDILIDAAKIGTATLVNVARFSADTGFTVASTQIASAAGVLQAAAFGSQTANTFLAAPNGSSGSASFRAIVAADLPGSFGGFANPAATIGLTAVNGSATTAMRSDAAPALSQAINPTWSGTHIFSNPPQEPAYTVGTLPSAPATGIAQATNEGGGKKLVSSNATNWRRVIDMQIASATGDYTGVWAALSQRYPQSVQIGGGVSLSLIQQAYDRLNAAGLLAKLTGLWVFNMATSADALINWITPGTNNATITGSPTFTAGQGFTGDGSTGLINLPPVVTLGGVQNNFTLGVYVRTAQTTSAKAIIGKQSGARNMYLQSFTSGALSAMFNSTNAGSYTPPRYIGMFTMARGTSANFQASVDDSAQTTIAQVSTGIGTVVGLTLLGTTDTTASEFSTAQLSFAFAANQALTLADIANLRAIMVDFFLVQSGTITATVANLPPAANFKGSTYFVPDLGGGGGLLESDGTNWFRTGFAGYAVDTTATGAETITYLTNASNINNTATLTGAETITLSGTDAKGTTVKKGAEIRFRNAGLGAFTITIKDGPSGTTLATIASVTAKSYLFVFDGTNWQVMQDGTI